MAFYEPAGQQLCQQTRRTYIAIDLKSFYASVECQQRGLDPLTTNLVVADASRTEKTICLAVSPSLKAYGIPGRARLFEVVQRLKEVNAERQMHAPGRQFTGKSYDAGVLRARPDLAIHYLAAPPQMALYIEYSSRIYQVYLKYVAPEDIHVYSIDEVFIDATAYLGPMGISAHDFARMMIKDVLKTTGITAAAGIGPNLYLAKIAMDIEAKHVDADEDGVRIAELDEMSYRRKMWDHRPITDFWRVGRGYAKKLAAHGMYTMGDVARCSLGKPSDFHNEDLLYKLFGVNAELLIDHAWGYEPCTMEAIKAYRPETNSIGSGQVLQDPYPSHQARLVVWEMTDMLALDLLAKHLLTDQLVLTVGYDIENLTDPVRARSYKGPVTVDYYGRRVPKHAHGTINLGRQTSSSRLLTEAVMKLYDEIVDPSLLVRRVNIVAGHVITEAGNEAAVRAYGGEYRTESEGGGSMAGEQLDMFTNYAEEDKRREAEAAELEEERRMQEALLAIKEKFGKNAVLKGANLEEGATAMQRNKQIGGHKA